MTSATAPVSATPAPPTIPAAPRGLPDISIPVARTCVPARLDATRWENLQPYYAELTNRPVNSVPDLEQWLLDRSELEAACSESRATLYIATTANTEDQAINDAYTTYLEHVAPKLEEAAFELDRRFVELASKFPLDAGRFGVLIRSKKAAVELFRSENIPLFVELGKLGQEYGKIAGAQTVNFDGAERTMAQMAVYQQSTDRAVREAAWKAGVARRLADREATDDVLDKMVALRDKVALNAGFRASDGVGAFVHYTFLEKRRFDYTPADCRRFWQAAEKHVVPFVRRIDEKRRRALGVDRLRPWDLAVDTKGRPGLRPFKGGRELFDKSVRVMERLDPRLGWMLARLGDGAPTTVDPARGFVSEALDLDSRRGKRPGGYMYVRDRSRRPFIFMNSAGLHRDAMTMVHEAGHAFHSMLAGPDWVLDYREAPIEFAEVASMSMEHLTMAHWRGGGTGSGTGTGTGLNDGYYASATDAARAQREHLEDSVAILAWIATIDAFQHWMYTQPTHTRTQRDDYWIELDQRFGRAVSWEGFEDARRSAWQRQGHLFGHPLYYIEYGIAQLGALQVWLRGKREGERVAVDDYIKALRLGGSRPLPELFAAAGVKFDFGDATVARVIEAVEKELESIVE